MLTRGDIRGIYVLSPHLDLHLRMASVSIAEVPLQDLPCLQFRVRIAQRTTPVFHSRLKRLFRAICPIYVGYFRFSHLSPFGRDPLGFAAFQEAFPEVATQERRPARVSCLGWLNSQVGEVL